MLLEVSDTLNDFLLQDTAMEIDSSDEDEKALEFTEFDFVPPAHDQPRPMGLQTTLRRR